jgi:hypothetical protein
MFGGREWGKQKLWHSWEEHFAHYGLAVLLNALIAFVYAFAGSSTEDSPPTYDPPLAVKLKFFFGVFLFFFLPTLAGLWRGQKIVAKIEALKSNHH